MFFGHRHVETGLSCSHELAYIINILKLIKKNWNKYVSVLKFR